MCDVFLCGKMFALCGFRGQIFMGSPKRRISVFRKKTAQKREELPIKSPIFTFEQQRANFEEEDKREENTRKKRTRAQAPPR
jgi:hypothetical protein